MIRALVWSLVLHALAVILAALPMVREALAAWQASSEARAQAVTVPPPAPVEVEVVVPQVTVVPPPAVPDKSFIRTDGLAEAKPDPGRSRFISDRDTRAASPGPADPSATEAQPTQEGVDIPVVEVIRNEQSDGEDETVPPSPNLVGAAASPDAGPDSASAPTTPPSLPAATPAAESPEAAATPTEEIAAAPPEPPVPIPPPVEERLALARESDISVPPDTPKPSQPARKSPPVAKAEPTLRDPQVESRPPSPPSEPPKRPAGDAPPSGFSALRVPTKLRGTISNQGPASVDAEDTPTGRYMKQVTSAIEKEWHRKRRVNQDFVTFGTIKLEFFVTAKGEVEDLTIKNRSGANAVMQDFTLNAVLDARIPPMPDGLTEILDRERLLISYDIIVY